MFSPEATPLLSKVYPAAVTLETCVRSGRARDPAAIQDAYKVLVDAQHQLARPMTPTDHVRFLDEMLSHAGSIHICSKQELSPLLRSAEEQGTIPETALRSVATPCTFDPALHVCIVTEPSHWSFLSSQSFGSGALLVSPRRALCLLWWAHPHMQGV